MAKHPILTMVQIEADKGRIKSGAYCEPVSVSSHGMNSGVCVVAKRDDGQIVRINLPQPVVKVIREDLPKHFENPAYAWGCFHIDPPAKARRLSDDERQAQVAATLRAS